MGQKLRKPSNTLIPILFGALGVVMTLGGLSKYQAGQYNFSGSWSNPYVGWYQEAAAGSVLIIGAAMAYRRRKK
jgi:hypothetical protein